MNDPESKIKQQIVDKLKSATNILVTVSRDPSVDDLTALLGLTALLNKLGKHATAIFSGTIPAAINFLDPEKVIENTADSLRDFIIALDKEKADHLRYKIEGDVVKIFITPYRTTITSSDLEFSQGDLNVELVLALGIENKNHLDEVLTSQNGIFNDAEIISMSDGVRKSDLGNISWNDKNASCLSEMIASLAENFKSEKEKTILDKQISSALLTGIVAATDRFSNIRTTAKVMTVAAQLIASGADPQLIAAKLQEAHEITQVEPQPEPAQQISSSEIDMPADLDEVPASTLPPEQKNNLVINHDEPEEEVGAKESTLPEVEPVSQVDEKVDTNVGPELEINNNSTLPDELANPLEVAEPTINTMPEQSDHTMPKVVEPILPQPGVNMPEEAVMSTLSPEDEIQNALDSLPANNIPEPTFGGTLNATAEQAAEDTRRELEDERNKTTLSHSYLEQDNSPQMQTAAPINSASQPSPEDKSVDIFNEPNIGATVPNIEVMPIVEPPKLDDMPPPPPAPDISSMMPPSTIPNFAPPVMATAPNPVVNDPSQFRIPGQ